MNRADLLTRARKLVEMRAIRAYSNWSFGSAGTPIDARAKERKQIWEYFNSKKYFPNLLVKIDRDIKINLALGDDLSWCLFVGGCIDPNELTFIKQNIKKGMVFIDVGANNGIYSLVSAKLVGNSGKVVAIEPSSRERRRLIKNISLNPYKNIQVHPEAVSDHKGNKTLYIASREHNGQNTMGKFIYDGVKLFDKEVVRLDKLDNIVERLGLSRVDFIKMDVEGSEYLALLGAKKTIKRFKPKIQIEISGEALRGQSADIKDVFRFLKSRKYDLFGFDSLTGKPRKIVGRVHVGELSLNILAIPNKQ